MSSFGGMAKADRRIEQGQATRDRLVAIATELFAKQGYEGTSIELVLEKAAVSRGAKLIEQLQGHIRRGKVNKAKSLFARRKAVSREQ